MNLLRKKSTGCTYWKDSTVFHESAEWASSGRGRKSWYLSFHVERAVGTTEGFLIIDAVRHCGWLLKSAAATDDVWMSDVECEVPGRRRTLASV